MGKESMSLWYNIINGTHPDKFLLHRLQQAGIPATIMKWPSSWCRKLRREVHHLNAGPWIKRSAVATPNTPNHDTLYLFLMEVKKITNKKCLADPPLGSLLQLAGTLWHVDKKFNPAPLALWVFVTMTLRKEHKPITKNQIRVEF